jgi:diaminopimelate decarboxylase
MGNELRRHDRTLIANVVRQYLQEHDIERSAYFYDLGLLAERLRHLEAVFPPDTLHAVAIKSQPGGAALAAIVAQGHGLEAASFEEVEIAIAARGRRLAFLDIGGGIGVRQAPGSQPGLEGFHAELLQRSPAISKYRLVTEYGRLVHDAGACGRGSIRPGNL